MNKIIAVFFIFSISKIVTSQNKEKTIISGKVNADMTDLKGIYVVNLKTEKAVVTQSDGFFAIPARVGDTLIFSSIELKKVFLQLREEDFLNSDFRVKMVPEISFLDEVVVKNYGEINAKSLGIIPKNQKTYTDAERKLKAARSLNPTASTGSMAGGSISGDPLLNMFSGRTAMLKKELEVERKEFFMRLLEEMFSPEHFVINLKIPSDYVKGFKYFVVENESFTKILNSKNKVSTEFLLSELAEKYKNILICEEE